MVMELSLQHHNYVANIDSDYMLMTNFLDAYQDQIEFDVLVRQKYFLMSRYGPYGWILPDQPVPVFRVYWNKDLKRVIRLPEIVRITC